MLDPRIAKAIALGSSDAGITAARIEAKHHLPEFPHNGCAAYLSSLLREAGLSDLPVILGAQALADRLHERGWERVSVGGQRPGDVGVTLDLGGNPGADHVYLVLRTEGPDRMVIGDNQTAKPHERYASGQGRTPTAYFLRAPDV